MKHTTRPKLQVPDGTYMDPDTGALVMPEGTPLDLVPYYTQEEHDGPLAGCEECRDRAGQL